MAAKRKSKSRKPQQAQPPAFDPVREASEESFPASDAPAWPSSEPVSGVKRKKKDRSR